MRNKLIWLIASRLTIILVLLGTASILNILSPASHLVKVFIGATLISSLLSILYGLFIKLSTRYVLQAYIQLIFDVLFVSWIVYRTAATEKSFAALYLVVVLAASTVLPRAAVLFTALLCAFSYTIVIGLVYTGFLNLQVESPYLSPETSAPLYILAMLVIGVLGGQISERLRSSHVELTRATENLASLQAFNERIIESIHSGLVTTDIEGKILTFNRAAEELTQYKMAQVLNRNFWEIFGDLTVHFNFGPEALHLTRPVRFMTICQSANGHQKHFGFTASLLLGGTDKIPGLVFSFQDLTEITKLEQEIRRRDRLASMGKMAAGIAHEIRNPLAAMRGSVQVLRSELDLSEDQSHLMQIVLRESDRLDKIVSDFLAYARPTPPKPMEFDLVLLVSETASLLRYSADLTDAHKVITECAQEQFLFRADANQIRQVIWNLARNAVQAMPNGGTLKIGLRETEKREVEFTFTDTGVGMSEAEMERMFEPFNSSRPGGTGLGLAIVFQIIADHNGKISVESKPNLGTKITLLLPHPDSLSAETDLNRLKLSSVSRATTSR
jgi:two-component system, NtrC family, sensor histidine kinase PilS